MNKKRVIKITILLLILLVISFFSYRSFTTPGKFDSLAKCMTQAGLVMYGSDRCPHCLNQKQLFGKSFKYINYKNCDFNKVLCEINNVTGYPTWIYKDKSLAGEQQLETLASLTGCQIDQQ